MAMERNCTLLLHYDKSAPPNEDEIKVDLESKDIKVKVEALKSTIQLTLNGESMPSLLMTVIRFCVPCDDHMVKKLLLIYFEVVDKHGTDGRLLPEMILVCNNLRNDLQHPNEYIRGSTLRFLCKLNEAELLEPLIPTIKSNLEHRHSYVRRNAVNTAFQVFRHFEGLMPDAPELIEKLLLVESDVSCKRNAFLMLFHCAQERAVGYLTDNLEQVANYGDLFQLVVLELIRKVCHADPYQKSKYIRCILTLFATTSSAVLFECSSTLCALTSSPSAIKAAAGSYCQLLSDESDHNVKLIVLERLQGLKGKHPRVMQEMVMDVLRALSSPNLDIRQKCLDITLDLITPRNIAEVVHALKKEVLRSKAPAGSDDEANAERSAEYNELLIGAIRTCAVKFPDVAATVVPVLMEFLADAHQAAAVDVALFVREIVEVHPALRPSVISKAIGMFPQVTATRVLRICLWILGEYCTDAEEVAQAFTAIKAGLGSLPLAPAAGGEDGAGGGGGGATADGGSATTRRVASGAARITVLTDGTYATQLTPAAKPATTSAAPAANSGHKLRELIVGGDSFLAAVAGASLTKLALRTRTHVSDARIANLVSADVMAILISMLRLGHATAGGRVDADSAERLSACLLMLSRPSAAVSQHWLGACHATFATMLSERKAADDIAADVAALAIPGKGAKAASARAAAGGAPAAAAGRAGATGSAAQPDIELRQVDALINLRQLRPGGAADVDMDDDDLAAADGLADGDEPEDFAARLKRVTQLTGLSDPVYAEAFVTVHQYDVVLDVLIVNQSSETMANLCLELATVGDLKLCERPQSYALAPGEARTVRANIKVASTETGIVFGSIVYDATGPLNAERTCIVLHDIHIDILDYIAPAPCTDLAFRAMWAEFEWENKVAVNTEICDVGEFLQHVVKSTNMRCLTPPSALGGHSGFLAANLYARSNFGEAALVNVSIERRAADGKITGYIRIRSKTQGIALSLGDKITLKQKGAK
jgi:coatomer subunit beta